MGMGFRDCEASRLRDASHSRNPMTSLSRFQNVN